MTSNLTTTMPATQGISATIPPQRSFREPIIPPIQRPTTVLVADPEQVAGAFLRPALIELAGCRVVEAGSLADVHEIVESGLVGDVAMVSIRFRSNTAQVIRTLRTAGWPRVIALMPPTADVAQVMEVIAAGASGVVSTPGVALVAPDDALPVHSLTPREIEVIKLVAQGCSNKEIGERMELSPLTVKSHLGRIARKLGVGDRAHIVAMACRGQVLGQQDHPDRDTA